MALKAGRGSPLAVRNGFEEDDGFQNSPLGLESYGKDICSMGSGGKGRRKEKEKEKKEDTRTTEFEDNVAVISRQRRQKAYWYFVTSRIKSASARIPL